MTIDLPVMLFCARFSLGLFLRVKDEEVEVY